MLSLNAKRLWRFQMKCRPKFKVMVNMDISKKKTWTFLKKSNQMHVKFELKLLIHIEKKSNNMNQNLKKQIQQEWEI